MIKILHSNHVIACDGHITQGIYVTGVMYFIITVRSTKAERKRRAIHLVCFVTPCSVSCIPSCNRSVLYPCLSTSAVHVLLSLFLNG